MKAFSMGSNMNERSILKQTLFLTAKLLGIFSIWVALVTVVAVVAADRMVLALSGASADKSAPAAVDATKKDEGATPRTKNPPANATTKTNG
jgi:hypothetical protein